jgi:uncharacterized Zn-binding protein involved in type VI secretion
MSPSSRHRDPASFDALLEIVQGVRLPSSFRPDKGCRRQRGVLPLGSEWADDLAGSPGGLVEHASSTPGAAAMRSVGRNAIECVERGEFTSWPDGFAHPDPMLEVDADDAVWSFDPKDAGRFEHWNRMVFTPAAGYAARRGDVMLHGGAIAPALGSPNVSIGGRPALRSCDTHVSTSTPPTPYAAARAGFVATFDKVKVNGFSALRVGDYCDEGPHGLDPITVGCRSVVIGPPPAPVECWRLDEARPPEPPERIPFRWHRARAGRSERRLVLGAELGGRAQVEGMTMAARLWAEQPGATPPSRARTPREPQPPETPAQHEHEHARRP